MRIKEAEKKCTPLLGMSDASGPGMEVARWEKKNRRVLRGHRRYGRVIICRAWLGERVIGLGDEFNVAVIHVHNMLGSTNTQESKRAEYPRWFTDLLRTHNVQVVLGLQRAHV